MGPVGLDPTRDCPPCWYPKPLLLFMRLHGSLRRAALGFSAAERPSAPIMPMALCPYAMLATRGCCCCCCNCMTCCCRSLSASDLLLHAPDLVLLGCWHGGPNCIGSCWSTVRMRCWQKLVIASASASTEIDGLSSMFFGAFKLLGRVRDSAAYVNELSASVMGRIVFGALRVCCWPHGRRVFSHGGRLAE
jgi:hypothetical protein